MSALHVVFEIDGVEYAVPAADVVQMESYSGATRVPGTPEYVAGLMQVRGRVVPVIDVRRRFGLPIVERSIDTRVVVVDLGSRTLGLVVDRAREVLPIAPEQIRPAPAIVTDRSGGLVKAVAQVADRLLLLIEVERIAGEEERHAERAT